MLLEVSNLTAAYGSSQVLFGMSFAIGPGEVVTLLGRNGMGKTTTVRTLSGLLPIRSGDIRLAGEAIGRLPPHRIARLGLGLVPEGRHIFPNLTVRENLLMAAANPLRAADPWTMDKVIEFFPRLGARLTNGGNQLSGGEQQMLAIGRAMVARPRLMMLDEPSLGLAPLIIKEIFAIIRDLRSRGITILLVEQMANLALRIADRAYVLDSGRITMSGTGAELLAHPEIRKAYLGNAH